MTNLDHYIDRFRKLRSDRNARWPANSLHRSPYKPLLLLSVLDLFAQGIVTSNLIKLTPDLGELFNLYCSQIMPPDWRCNIAMPFFHLSGDDFWHLAPLPGKESIIASGRRLRSVSLLVDNVAGARLDDELYTLLCVDESRNVLRALLIETYFVPQVQQILVEQGIVNSEAFEYSQVLLEQAQKRQTVKEEKTEQKEYKHHVRDQGFRRAVVTAYSHRCALCGIRILTPDGHTSIVAAHIIPWSVSHNDDPRNGISLCHLCHWTFDKGLIGIASSYIVMISPRLAANQNIPGHLVTLNDRSIIGPEEQYLWPDLDSLAWHIREVFRRR